MVKTPPAAAPAAVLPPAIAVALPLHPSRDDLMSAAHRPGETGVAAYEVEVGDEGGAARGRRGAAAPPPAPKRARAGAHGGSQRKIAQEVDHALEAELDAMEQMQQAAWHTSSSDGDDTCGGDAHDARSKGPFVPHAEARKTFKKKRIQSSVAETKKLAQAEAAENGRLLP